MLFVCHPPITENNAYAKFWADKQRALWYVMVCYGIFCSGQLWQSIIVSIRKQFGGPAGVGAFNCGAINCFYKPGFGPSIEILLVTNL